MGVVITQDDKFNTKYLSERDVVNCIADKSNTASNASISTGKNSEPDKGNSQINQNNQNNQNTGNNGTSGNGNKKFQNLKNMFDDDV
jgi:hypothetical protein